MCCLGVWSVDFDGLRYLFVGLLVGGQCYLDDEASSELRVCFFGLDAWKVSQPQHLLLKNPLHLYGKHRPWTEADASLTRMAEEELHQLCVYNQ